MSASDDTPSGNTAWDAMVKQMEQPGPLGGHLGDPAELDLDPGGGNYGERGGAPDEPRWLTHSLRGGRYGAIPEPPGTTTRIPGTRRPKEPADIMADKKMGFRNRPAITGRFADRYTTPRRGRSVPGTVDPMRTTLGGSGGRGGKLGI
jgi:hypothetical protein